MRSENTPDRPAMIVFGVVFLIFAVLSLAAGVGLWKLREWGRILQIVLAVIGLLGIPLGTIISILLLIYFTRPHIKLLFAGKRLDQLTPEETALLSQTASSAGSGAAVAIAVIVVVLVIVAIVGILAAIAIPNLLTAMERSKQKRTMADIRSIAASVEVSRASQNALPQTMPARKDGWGTDIVYKNDGTNYWIVSAGKDARFEEEDPSHYSAGATTNFDCDIVFGNGEFRRAPEGVQQQ